MNNVRQLAVWGSLVAVFTFARASNVQALGPAGAHETVNAVLGDVSWHASGGHGAPKSASESERITRHLAYVEMVLRKRDVRHLSDAQRRARLSMLDVLAAYWRNGRFPRRTGDGFSGRRPRFIDDRGVHCAVGHLLAASGDGSLARSIQERFEYAYVANIDEPALGAWAKEHGFSVTELAMIKPGYGPLPFHRTLSVDSHGGFAPIGVGLGGGLRLGIALLRPGWYGDAMEDSQGQDVLRLVLGIDGFHVRRRDGVNEDYGLALGFPVGLAWELYSSTPFSWFFEVGANVFIHPGRLRDANADFVDHWANWVFAGIGGIWRFTENFAAVARVGLPVSGVGLRYEFGDASFRPGP